MILDLIETRNGNPSATDDFWYRALPSLGDAAGSRVGTEEAMSLSAWWNAISLLAGTIGSIPLKLYRRDGENAVVATEDPRHRLVYRAPTPWHTAMEWRELCMGQLLSRGNAFNRILRDDTGRARAVEPIHPNRVRVEARGGEIVYCVRQKTGAEKEYAASEILHFRGLGSDGLTGLSVVSLARRSLGYSLELERHGAALMSNKARPGGILATDQNLKPEQRKDLAATWDKMYNGGGIGRTAVVDGGLRWQDIGLSNEDAQFVETREFQIQEIARWFNLPPHFLKDMSRATFSNIEQQAIEFVTHTIRPWAERIEQRLDLSLLDESEQGELFFKFSLEGLLRGDSAARAAYYQSLFNMGALSPNDIRKLEDMNSVEGGDERFVQLNLQTLTAASEPLAPLAGSAARALDERRSIPARSIETREARSLAARRRLMDVYARLFEDSAGRLVRREVADLRRLLDAVDDGDTEEFLRRLEIFGAGLPDAARAIFEPTIAAYVDQVAAEAAAEVGDGEYDEARVVAWRSAYVDSFATGHASTTTGRIVDTMTEAEGDPFANARGMLDRWEEDRAGEIALREAVTIAGATAAVVYSHFGRGSVWRATGKENCPYCSALDGMRVAPDEPFFRKGDAVDPGGGVEPLTFSRNVKHPQAHAGCDCTISAG